MKGYILKGKRVVRAKSYEDAMTWWSENSRQVVDTKLPNNISVSTVFLGGASPMFETMSFLGSHGLNNGKRYSTWKQAEAGHLEALNREMNCRR